MHKFTFGCQSAVTDMPCPIKSKIENMVNTKTEYNLPGDTSNLSGSMANFQIPQPNYYFFFQILFNNLLMNKTKCIALNMLLFYLINLSKS